MRETSSTQEVEQTDESTLEKWPKDKQSCHRQDKGPTFDPNEIFGVENVLVSI